MTSSSSSTRPNNGPLTTTFVPPATCSQTGIVSGYRDAGWLGVHCFTSMTLSGGQVSTSIFGSILYDYTCLPSSTQTFIQASGVWSPGLICPAGYTQACSGLGRSAGQTPTGFQFQFPLDPGETGIGCCPESHYCDGTNNCLTVATNGASFPVMECAGPDLTSTSTFMFTVASPSTTFPINAQMVQLVYQSSDLEHITIVKPTTTVTETSASDGGLSAGDKAGIGVGVVAIVLLIIALILGWLLLRRRAGSKSRREKDKSAEHFLSPGGWNGDLRGGQVNELGGRPGVRELPGKPNDSELPG